MYEREPGRSRSGPSAGGPRTDPQVRRDATAAEAQARRAPPRATGPRARGRSLDPDAARFVARRGDQLEPLARAFADRLGGYLEILTYPIRVGTHSNTAFALVLALDWAEAFHPPLAHQIRDRARHWFGADRDCQAWEPAGDEFLSPALIEALCMARTEPALFQPWFGQFLPRLGNSKPVSLFSPAIVSDRSDGKIAHLDGLNLSRAWCWRSIAPLLSPAGRAVAEDAADTHLAAALPHMSGDYMGEHWLASFALLALLARDTS